MCIRDSLLVLPRRHVAALGELTEEEYREFFLALRHTTIALEMAYGCLLYTSFPRFGQVSHLSRERMIELAREHGGNPDDERKRDPLDFVLWQPSLEDEPAWDCLLYTSRCV